MSTPVKFIDGREFPSLAAAAQALDISPPALLERLDKWQYPFSNLMPDRAKAHCKPCYFRGKHYPSRIAAARAHAVSRQAVQRAISRQNSMA